MKIFILPLIFLILGFLFSTKTWIRSYDKLSPFLGLVFYYIILTCVILILEYYGLVIGGFEFSGFKHTLGSILIVFSFFIIFDWESCYVNTVTKGDCKEVSNVYLASEDGAVYYLWDKLFPNKHNLNRILTFMITPFVLCLLGMILISGGKAKIHIS